MGDLWYQSKRGYQATRAFVPDNRNWIIYQLYVCIFTEEPLVFHGNYVLNIMSSELANSSDVSTSPSERGFERKPGEPFKGLEVQVSPNLKQNMEALGSSSSYITCLMLSIFVMHFFQQISKTLFSIQSSLSREHRQKCKTREIYRSIFENLFVY